MKEFDVTDSLEPDPEDPEIDLEGTTRKGRFLFWIASHSRKADDDGNVKAAASRHRLLATTIPALGGKPLRVEGVYITGHWSRMRGHISGLSRRPIHACASSISTR